ncbi:bifunctional 4-hydroxy-2-oxoglutarate aldolase/2-dehydro-3-deoxy-phosphogluconate aldolase [Halobacillus kuroshimensis]|uniref:Bifunctional 4-hydroxy-2-oxoglutarate aldolase/2-dehydro-3-deoxy-phosphogluconate aldolase n=1 Tax=Halobacillus kuroshimensis TaxID=302481 RepID=A0ABS3DYG2_9BACI|nr:bifunctional 4-hydroxy-2-oxoglutarate aldolase/2-dehydro-3-deoxy-phosphogluconate aldolase [Halobacillus kuroshimensis]MBN8236400.1 bifunctional 4-hydroxy-2-oxoglutarate aldolase/2-dehydro-3-deoxy-phosphogluconate aldolase [Halobacillus kuroshimensis]
MNTAERLKQARVIPVIRRADETNILKIAEALVNGGIQAIEITAETKDAAKLIRKTADAFEGKLLVGAGTVLDPETAREMIAAGAAFVVAPTLNVKTIELVHRYGLPCIPGVLTPTEIQTALEAGAGTVKIFPAGTVGPSYIKNVLGPLPQVSIMATGGIHLDNMEEYFANGAEIVGIGSQLVKASALKTDSDYQALQEKAGMYVDRVQQFHEQLALHV